MVYIPADKLEYLAKHKYNSTGYSYLDLFLNKFLWEPLVTLFPRTLAPNLITVIGLLFMLTGYFVMFLYDTSFKVPMPAHVLLLSAFCQFMYQTLDACDGKQARRIGLSSPLGMLMDHGCDSLTSSVLIFQIIQGLGIGLTNNTLVLLMSVHTTFFLAMWEEYHTHYARTHMFSWGVTEGQWTLITLMLVTAAYGSQIWQSVVWGVRLEDLLVITNSGWGGAVSMLMVLNTLGKVTGIQPFLRLVPIAMLNFSLYLWFENPLSQTYGHLVLIVHAFIFAGICSKVIICSTAIMKFGWFHLEVVVELLFLLEDKYLKILPSEVTCFILCLYIVLNYFTFVYSVVNQLAGYLKLSVFRVAKS